MSGLTPGWFARVDEDCNQIGVLHYFEVVPAEDGYDIEDGYRPICGTHTPDMWDVDHLGPYSDNTRCKRCEKKTKVNES